MAGTNVVAAYFGGTGRNQILPQTLATVTETEFKVGADANTTTIAVLSMPLQGAILGAQTPQDQATNSALLNSGFTQLGYSGDANPPFNSGTFDGSKPFLVRVAGSAVPASNAANSLLIKLYLGTTKAGTNIAATSAVAINASVTPVGFILEAQLIWDSASTSVRGQFWYNVNGTTPAYVTWAALTSSAGVAAAVANLQFCASATYGNAVGGVCSVSEFSISRL